MEIKRILVSRTDKIGDLILSIPSFFMLKKMYPNAELVAIVRKYNMDIVKNLPYIDRFVVLDDYTKAELLEKIAYFKADVFIALYNDAYIAALARASKAKIRIGPISKLNSFFTYFIISVSNLLLATLIDLLEIISSIERIAISVEPPPISITVFPSGNEIFTPEPTTAAFPSSRR